MGKGLQIGDRQQVLYGFRRLPETVHELLQHILVLLLVLYAGNAFVYVQLLVFVWNVAGRDEGIHIQVDGCLEVLLLFDSFCLLYRLTQHLAVKVISHCLHMAVLLRTQ